MTGWKPLNGFQKSKFHTNRLNFYCFRMKFSSKNYHLSILYESCKNSFHLHQKIPISRNPKHQKPHRLPHSMQITSPRARLIEHTIRILVFKRLDKNNYVNFSTLHHKLLNRLCKKFTFIRNFPQKVVFVFENFRNFHRLYAFKS